MFDVNSIFNFANQSSKKEETTNAVAVETTENVPAPVVNELEVTSNNEEIQTETTTLEVLPEDKVTVTDVLAENNLISSEDITFTTETVVPFETADETSEQNETENIPTVVEISPTFIETDRVSENDVRKLVANITDYDKKEKTEETEALFEKAVDTGMDYFNSVFEQLEKKSDEAEAKRLEEQNERAKKQEEKKKSKSSSTTATPTFDVKETTKIRIGRDELLITDLFTTEEILNGIAITKKDQTVENKKITAEDVRIRLEKIGYVEFVKGYVEMAYIADRDFIIPMPLAKKKGNVEVQEEVQSSTKDDFASFLFRIGKRIPYRLFAQFVALAKMFGRLNLEVRANFFYNHTTKEFHLHIPQQRVHEYWVTSTEPNHIFVSKTLDNVELVCEIHSHHRFIAKPSSTDDKSERMPGMTYVIVGTTDKEEPSIFLRTFLPNGQYQLLNLNDVFSTEESKYYDFNSLPFFRAEWIEIIR